MPEFGRIDADTVGMLSTACRNDDMQAASENIKTQALRERRSPVTCPRCCESDGCAMVSCSARCIFPSEKTRFLRLMVVTQNPVASPTPTPTGP